MTTALMFHAPSFDASLRSVQSPGKSTLRDTSPVGCKKTPNEHVTQDTIGTRVSGRAIGQSELIIDYATAPGSDKPISTATAERTVQWLLHRRMGANQQVRWSPGGTHLVLRVRTSVKNRPYNEDHTTAEQWVRRPFHKAA